MRLMNCFYDTLHLTLWYQEEFNQGNHHEFDEVKLKIDRSLTDHEQILDGEFTEDHYRNALLAVTAFVDEIFSLSLWKDKDMWKGNLLQKRHFETVNAGELFFENLEQLSVFNPAELDIREVYYYCLALGFRGKYFREKDQSHIQVLIQNNLDLLKQGRKGEETLDVHGRIFPEAYIPGKTGAGISLHMDFKPFIIGIPVILLMVTYFLLRSEISQAVNLLITTL